MATILLTEEEYALVKQLMTDMCAHSPILTQSRDPFFGHCDILR